MSHWEKLYERYHAKSGVSRKVVERTNFTYINILSILDQYISTGGLSVLDLGCGVGSLSFYIASKNNRVVGVDISEKAIAIANESLDVIEYGDRVKFFCRKIELLNENNKFDLVLASEILEHIPNDTLVLKKINFYLKNNGILILTVPSSNAPLYKYGLLKNFDKSVGHLRRYSAISLQNKLTRNYFKVFNLYKREGFLRNLLFTNSKFNYLIRFLRGFLAIFVNYLDNLTIVLFGESQLIFVCRKVKK